MAIAIPKETDRGKRRMTGERCFKIDADVTRARLAKIVELAEQLREALKRSGDAIFDASVGVKVGTAYDALVDGFAALQLKRDFWRG